MKIAIKNLQKKIPINPKRIKSAILNLLSQEGALYPVEITVCFMRDRQIKQLNRKYLNKDAPTDVLAFAMPHPKEPGKNIFDIAVSADTAVRNSRFFKSTPQKELKLYVIHGLLHLLGYDDLTLRKAALMRKKEKQYADT